MKNPFVGGHAISESTKSIAPSAIPGLHIVANFLLEEGDQIRHSAAFREFIEGEIKRLGLTSVGEIFHDFESGGFTAVVCLTESHLSIHTWPEANYLTFDVFISNYLKDNRVTTRLLYDNVKRFFKATVTFEQIIER